MELNDYQKSSLRKIFSKLDLIHKEWDEPLTILNIEYALDQIKIERNDDGTPNRAVKDKDRTILMSDCLKKTNQLQTLLKRLNDDTLFPLQIHIWKEMNDLHNADFHDPNTLENNEVQFPIIIIKEYLDALTKAFEEDIDKYKTNYGNGYLEKAISRLGFVWQRMIYPEISASKNSLFSEYLEILLDLNISLEAISKQVRKSHYFNNKHQSYYDEFSKNYQRR